MKIWSKQLLLTKPDPTPYLLAAKSPRVVRLLAASGAPLLYTLPDNADGRINTLTNAKIGNGTFDIKFYFTPNKTAKQRLIFDIPGLAKFMYDWSRGVGFAFQWRNENWRVYSNAQVGDGGWVHIYRESIVDDIKAELFGQTETLYTSWEQWIQPSSSQYSAYYSNDIFKNGMTISRPTMFDPCSDGYFTRPYDELPDERLPYVNIDYKVVNTSLRSNFDDSRNSCIVTFDWDRMMRIKKYRIVYPNATSYPEDTPSSQIYPVEDKDWYANVTVGTYKDITRTVMYESPSYVKNWTMYKRPASAPQDPIINYPDYTTPYTGGDFRPIFVHNRTFGAPLYTKRFSVYWNWTTMPSSFPTPYVSFDAERLMDLDLGTANALIEYDMSSVSKLQLTCPQNYGEPVVPTIAPNNYPKPPANPKAYEWLPYNDEAAKRFKEAGYTDLKGFTWANSGYGTPTLNSAPLYPTSELSGPYPRFIWAASYDAWGMVYRVYDRIKDDYVAVKAGYRDPYEY